VPADKYHPLEDADIPPPERAAAFSRWVSGYYTHGDSAATLERRVPVDDPRPTILSITPEELQTVFHADVTGPGGSDLLLLGGGIATGLNEAMWRGALYLSGDGSGNEWADVELRYLWCDRSVYEMPWGTWALKKEVEDAKRKGLPLRNLSIVRLRGANHFVSGLCMSACLCAHFTIGSLG
jgi:hypothetical protein